MRKKLKNKNRLKRFSPMVIIIIMVLCFCCFLLALFDLFVQQYIFVQFNNYFVASVVGVVVIVLKTLYF